VSRRAVLLSLLLLATLPAVAQQHPNTARGFNGGFGAGDVDSVNPFNGNLVIRIPIGQGYHVNGNLSYQLGLVYNNNVWDYQQYDDGTMTYTQALPNRTANAGLGWTVSLGRLNPPTSTDVDTTRTVYLSPDGSLHTFYPTLHEGETGVVAAQYTRDGTYLRYRPGSSEIDFPDGTIHRFRADGFPDQIRDRFGNQITITYGTETTSGKAYWTIFDGHRTQTVWFRTVQTGYPQQVDRIELAAFGGATAKWSFLYNSDDSVPYTVTGCRNTDPAYTNKPVPLLTQVTLPDGSRYRMVAADYGTQTTSVCDAGMLKGITLPTLGRIEWDYIEYAFPTDSSPRLFRQRSTGVGARRLKDASSLVLGAWSYSTALTADAGFHQPQELVNTVVTPLGDKQVNYFSVSTTVAASGWSNLDYGLPFTRYVTDGGSLTRYLSSRIYDCDAGAVNCQLKRTSFVTYDRDDSILSGSVEEATRKNQRVLSTRTNYDDVGLLEAVVFSSFDGLGHYRQSDLFGNFGAGDSRTTVVNYNPGQTFPGAFTPPAVSAPWVLNTYADTTATEGGVSAKAEYCFDATTGFLQRTRTLAAGTTRSANDVVMRYTALNGNVTTEESFGGDGGGLDTTAALCNLILPANQYQTNSTYQYGSLASEQAAPGIPFKTVDRDIDASTGLTATSRDVSSLVTNYQYDTLGRTTSVQPSQDGWTSISYTPAASATSLAQTYVARKSNGGGAVLAESKTLFDALGRVRQEQERMPDGTWSARTTTYNALGWQTSVSELGSANATSYLNFDPFGRPATIRPADGSAHDVTLSYGGTRTVSRTVKVATSYNTATGTAAETVATTNETYDRQGRLVQVTEPNGAITKYEYDVGSRLKRVCQGASGSFCGQERLFTYDNRGFLTSEKHPEKGASGNGTVSYLNYDSHGHARQVIDGPNDLTYSYDRAERISLIQETVSHLKLKELTYGPANLAGNSVQGKVQVAKRYNYPVLGGSQYTALITETYTYGGRQGRASQRDTQLSVNGGTNESFTQSFVWDDLGNPQTINYPQCTSVGCTSAARGVTDVYTNGWLTAISGYTGTAPGQPAGVGITYHPNGLVKDIAHSNGVVDTQTNDPNGIARPAAITAALGGTTLWTTGAYQYDGAGNIWKTGNAWYEYDALSRLKTGAVFPNPLGTGTQQKQTYSFDDYGNLQSITTQLGAGAPATRGTPASTVTNRLTGAVAYDSAGNLTSWNGATYEYDAFDQMRHMTSGAEDWVYIYTADDERVWSYKPSLNLSRWTLRGLDGKVLRDFTNNAGTWSVAEDYIYRNGLLFAAYLGTGQRRHFALDHLGTVRLVTNTAGTQTDYHVYYPFGEEATPFDLNADRMQFTGHERDLSSQAGANPAGDDLDYMHARYESPVTGRFLSPDPSQRGQNPSLPDSWNRYAYAQGNPLKYIDPDGQAVRCPQEGCPEWMTPHTFWQRLEKGFNEASILPGPMAVEGGIEKGGAELLEQATAGGLRYMGRGQPGFKIASKLGNIFNQELSVESIVGAARELTGDIIGMSRDVINGHVRKVAQAINGAERALGILEAGIANPAVSDAERAYLQYLVTTYSAKLQSAEQLFGQVYFFLQHVPPV
jgi:RHS repeat-associated protein